jgi:hypothetical protein
VQGSRKGDNISGHTIFDCLELASRDIFDHHGETEDLIQLVRRITRQINYTFPFDFELFEESDLIPPPNCFVTAELYGKWSICKGSKIFRQISQIVSPSRYF